jgi:hypothetical protein
LHQKIKIKKEKRKRILHSLTSPKINERYSLKTDNIEYSWYDLVCSDGNPPLRRGFTKCKR